jgi:hypothetical protein
MMTNCAATSSYEDSAIVISNPTVEVSTTSEDLIARWETDQPAKTTVWYWHTSRPNGEFMPLQTSLVTDHSILIQNDLWLWPNSEYHLLLRSPAWDVGDGHLGPLLATTGPWTIEVNNIQPDAATIRWQTLFPSSTRVEFGLTSAYGQEVSDATLVTDHQVDLVNLTPMTTYHFRVWSEADGYVPHHSADQTLATAVPPGPFISVAPGSISANAHVNSDPPDGSFTIRNSGDDTITYSITPDCSWLSAVPANGTSSGETDTITLVYDTKGLTAGTYECTLTASAPEAVNSPVAFPTVTMTLATVKPDFDGDGDVDQEDFGRFQVCLTGPGIFQPTPGCDRARLDGDDDVDSTDLNLFLGCLTYPGMTAEADCLGQP